MRCSSSLPPVLTAVRDDEGSSRITDAASSIHAHRDHHGLGRDVQPARNSASAHSVPTHTLSVPTEQSGVGQGGDDHSAYSSILAQRIAASFRLIMAEHQSPPMWGVTVGPLPILGCSDWTIAEFPTGALQAPRESRRDSTSNPPWSGSSTEKSGMTPPTENNVINQTNGLTASCSFEDVG